MIAEREAAASWVRLAWSVTLAAVVLALAGYRLRLGFSANDEGFALATAARYVLGDAPFRDEVFTVTRSSELLIALPMRLTTFDSVLIWRWWGLALQLLALAASGLLLRRLVPFYPLSLLLAALALYSPFNIWTPQYANSGMQAALAGVSLVLLGSLMSQWRGVACSLIGGLVLSVCAVVYVPMLALALPLGVLAAVPAGWVGTSSFKRATLVGLVGLMVGVALWAALLIASSLHESYAAALQLTQRQRAYFGVTDVVSDPLAALLFRASGRSNVLGTFAGAGTFAALTLAALLPRARAVRGVAIVALVIGLAALLYRFALVPDTSSYRTLSPRFTVLVFAVVGMGMGAAMALVLRWPRHPRGTPEPVCAGALLVLGIAAAVLLMMASANGWAELNVALWLLWAGAVAVAYQAGGHRPEWRLGMWAVLAAMLGASVVHLYSWTYEDAPVQRVTSPFSSPKLRGLYSSPERVRDLDALIECVTRHTRPGDYVLSYAPGAAGYTYLTDTRPPMRSVLLAVLPDQEMQDWVSDMIASGRQPRFIIAPEQVTGKNPFEQLTLASYSPVLALPSLGIQLAVSHQVRTSAGGETCG